MHHHSALDYLSLSAFTLVLLYGLGMTVFLSRQDKATKSSYLVRHKGRMMLFRRPLALRRSMIANAGLFAVIGFAFVVPSKSTLFTPVHILIIGFYCVAILLFTAHFVYDAGPNDIRLNGKGRTYERTTGWPWKPATQFGSFEDIKGICVDFDGQALLLMRKRTFLYKGVYLSGPSTSRPAQALARALARTLAEDVSREFGFPIVPYPK